MDRVNDRLKALRLRASPAISGRAMAIALGVTSSAYHFYENPKGFKGRYLPMELATRIATILADRAIDTAEVMALAGLDDLRPSAARSPAAVAPEDLPPGAAQLLDDFGAMEPEQRELLLQLANQMRSHRPGATPQPRPASATVHSGKRRFRAEKEHA